MSRIEANKRLIQTFIDYLQKQEYDRIAELFTDTYTWVIPFRNQAMENAKVPRVRSKAEAVPRMKANTDLMQAGMKLTPLAWTIQEDRVALEAEGTVVWKNGLIYNNLYHLAFVIRDGKIDKFTEYCDFLYAWETNPLLQNAPKPA